MVAVLSTIDISRQKWMEMSISLEPGKRHTPRWKIKLFHIFWVLNSTHLHACALRRTHTRLFTAYSLNFALFTLLYFVKNTFFSFDWLSPSSWKELNVFMLSLNLFTAVICPLCSWKPQTKGCSHFNNLLVACVCLCIGEVGERINACSLTQQCQSCSADPAEEQCE